MDRVITWGMGSESEPRTRTNIGQACPLISGMSAFRTTMLALFIHPW